MSPPADILAFWFGDAAGDPQQARDREAFWYGGSAQRDRDIAQRFGTLLNQASTGRLEHWAESPPGRLALVVLLDQFSRNIRRGTPAAFAQDARALAVAQVGVVGGEDRLLSEVERSFLYMPFQHAEDTGCQRQSVRLYERLLWESRPEFRDYVEHCLQHAEEHRAVIDRFGRFPHRNAILDRSPTEAERAYLGSGARRYGQVAGR